MASPPSHRTLALAAALVLLAVLADAGRRPPRPPRNPPSVYEDHSHDQQAAATGTQTLQRVQIKVYRGPDHHHHHASHGYWIKQPADDVPQQNGGM